MAQKTKDETMKAMNQAAHQAREEIDGPDVDAFKVVAQWWDRHYRRAGHKRLARVLLEFRDVR